MDRLSNTVYLVVGKRRRVHRAERVGSLLLTAEADNLDTATRRREVTRTEALAMIAADPRRRCRRCLSDLA